MPKKPEMTDTAGVDKELVPPAKKRRCEAKSNAGKVGSKPRGRKAFANHEGQPLPDVHYYFEKGLRKVVPYQFVYQTYVKGRWEGRPIIETFAKEFQDKPRKYYEKAIVSGKITINDQRITADYKPRSGDILCHHIHRHEPPVTADAIEIVYSDDNMLVVNKPSSIPIHPTGRYHHNTILHILRSPEFAYANLSPVNRLDRLTSGLCLIALNKEASQKLMEEFKQRSVKKTYLCRVRGEFPEEEVVCEEPIKTVSFKLGVNVVSPEGKDCKTSFKRLSYNGLTSVVECKPLTGRTHQIRVHLQYLGHPIANDPLYCRDFWGPQTGKGGVAQERIETILEELTPQDILVPSTSDRTSSIREDSEEQRADLALTGINDVAGARDPECSECAIRRMDPMPQQLQIWLHSWKCALESGQYATRMPAWAEPSFRGDTDLVDRFWKHGGKWDGLGPGVLIDD